MWFQFQLQYDKFSKKVDACYVVAAIKNVMDVCTKGATVVIESTVSPGYD